MVARPEARETPAHSHRTDPAPSSSTPPLRSTRPVSDDDLRRHHLALVGVVEEVADPLAARRYLDAPEFPEATPPNAASTLTFGASSQGALVDRWRQILTHPACTPALVEEIFAWHGASFTVTGCHIREAQSVGFFTMIWRLLCEEPDNPDDADTDPRLRLLQPLCDHMPLHMAGYRTGHLETLLTANDDPLGARIIDPTDGSLPVLDTFAPALVRRLLGEIDRTLSATAMAPGMAAHPEVRNHLGHLAGLVQYLGYFITFSPEMSRDIVRHTAIAMTVGFLTKHGSRGSVAGRGSAYCDLLALAALGNPGTPAAAMEEIIDRLGVIEQPQIRLDLVSNPYLEALLRNPSRPLHRMQQVLDAYPPVPSAAISLHTRDSAGRVLPALACGPLAAQTLTGLLDKALGVGEDSDAAHLSTAAITETLTSILHATESKFEIGHRRRQVSAVLTAHEVAYAHEIVQTATPGRVARLAVSRVLTTADAFEVLASHEDHDLLELIPAAMLRAMSTVRTAYGNAPFGDPASAEATMEAVSQRLAGTGLPAPRAGEDPFSVERQARATSHGQRVRAEVATCTTVERLLFVLAHDGSATVRRRVALNPAASPEVLRALASDPARNVRKAVTDRLAEALHYA